MTIKNISPAARREEIQSALAKARSTRGHDDSNDEVSAAIQDNLSPEAVAIIASLLQVASSYETENNRQAMKQVYWFRELCSTLTNGSVANI